MNQEFLGWETVAVKLRQRADEFDQKSQEIGDLAVRLNFGQRASLRAIAERIVTNGVLIADEVGMGKTRIAVEVARAVIASGGRVAIVIPPGLGYQWQAELRDGGLDVPRIIRSTDSYLNAWEVEENVQPLFQSPALLVSHAFTNWRIGVNAGPKRLALLPELYARWRQVNGRRKPRFYHWNVYEGLPRKVAESIANGIPRARKHPVRCLLDTLVDDVQWSQGWLYDGAEYAKGNDLRIWLERVYGCGLGVFDLIIIDEAHKNRKEDSGLSRLLNNVIVSSREAKRLSLTATPVELDVEQWNHTLERLQVGDRNQIKLAIHKYKEAVDDVRNRWRTSEQSLEKYKVAASDFKNALSPYAIRRDKTEEPDIDRFHEYSKLPFNDYRRETEIPVDPISELVSMPWRKAICAAESLSVVTRQSDDPKSKRLRLTFGNGHGIATWLDSVKRQDDDVKQEIFESKRDEGAADNEHDEPDSKLQGRAEWWSRIITSAFGQGDESLFDHPAILAAVDAIESAVGPDEKVLVFGRFIRPLRALVDLLNAREMLRRLRNEEPWPQEKVHGDPGIVSDYSEWPAVRAACRQFREPFMPDVLNESLQKQYQKVINRRERIRRGLLSKIKQGIHDDPRLKSIFRAFERAVESTEQDEQTEHRPLTLVARAMMAHLENPETARPEQFVETFKDLIEAVCDRDDPDDEFEPTEERADDLWESIKERLIEEYARTQGGFARLMYGGTSQASRRMMQLAFNRPHSFPRVLVAQSLVGREGLNLHKACRIVVILHPEWNPGVVEQQIGRVDRVGSHWSKKLDDEIAAGKTGNDLPRIEIRPVIFRGTYDEHNWRVLNARWDDLRAQLHGIVIPPSQQKEADEKGKRLIELIHNLAPNFSPTNREKN